MDVVFKPELDKLRQQNLLLAETCYMVVSAKKRKQLRTQKRDRETLSKLFQAAVDHAQQHHVDILCAETNPKHKLIYTVLGYSPIGNQRPNPAVNGAPALGRMLDLRQLPELGEKYPILRSILA
jgi:hypothetical protein